MEIGRVRVTSVYLLFRILHGRSIDHMSAICSCATDRQLKNGAGCWVPLPVACLFFMPCTALLLLYYQEVLQIALSCNMHYLLFILISFYDMNHIMTNALFYKEMTIYVLYYYLYL